MIFIKETIFQNMVKYCSKCHGDQENQIQIVVSTALEEKEIFGTAISIKMMYVIIHVRLFSEIIIIACVFFNIFNRYGAWTR